MNGLNQDPRAFDGKIVIYYEDQKNQLKGLFFEGGY